MPHPTAAAPAMQAEPNVTPMIDVLMVLLIIFMVIVPTSRKAFDVQIPSRSGGADGGAIVLDVGPDGHLALNQQPVVPAALGARLRAVYAGRPDKVITVRGERRARYADVIAAIDSARGAGIRVVSLDPAHAGAPD